MKSIYLRNFTATAMLVTISFLVVTLSFIGVGRNYVISEYKEDMVNSAKELVRTSSAIGQVDSLSSWSLGMLVSAVSNSTGNQIFISNAHGRIVTCSDKMPMCDHMNVSISPDILERLDANGMINEIGNLGGIFQRNRYIVGMPITSNADGENIGYVIVSNVIDNMLGAWSTFVSIAMFVMIGVFCAALIISLVYSKRMARPLDEIAAASRKFARGDFSVRVRQEEDPTAEMGALIDSFNKMADELEQSENRRSEFVANISHELRTPMTTIAGFADGILDGTISPEDQDKYLRSIRDETRRLSRLVRDMLTVSQAKEASSDETRRTVFDLTEFVLQILLSFEDRATKKNLDVEPVFPENSMLVRADKDAITQVIYNLLDNAVKFARPGSCLTLRVYKDKGKAYVSVKNIGETIPADDLPFIFDRFHKSDRSRSFDKEGVGLGLYLVKKILNSHDEDIAVRSEDSVTEFVFTLPLVD